MLGRRSSSDSPDPSQDESESSFAHLLRGLQDYLAARSELLEIESREAAEHAKRQTGLGIALAVAGFFGYTLVLVALILFLGAILAGFLPASLTPHASAISALLFGGLHLLIAFLALRKLRQPPATPLFEVTRAEFQKDREWIKDQQNRNGSNS
jgi:uncharacterized membrane protein YqjE